MTAEPFEYRFPEGFLWGAGTSAYQVEGSPLADGAGVSIQHRFAHTPGNTLNGQTGDIAADHYRRFRDDIAIMRDLGLKAYQFGVSWPRVMPDGTGRVNQRGLDFYDQLVEALLEAGVAPVPILYVWDLPGTRQDRGGWPNRDSAEWFGEYASVVYERLGDRPTHWLTLCEPASIAHAGHIAGEIAPAMRDLYAGLRAAHHVLLGHGRAVEAFRASGAKGQIGTSTLVVDVSPASDDEADVAAAERAGAYFNELYLDPIMLGTYPDVMLEWFGDAWPPVADGDLATISAPIDFLGVTYYFGMTMADRASAVDTASAGERAEAAILDEVQDSLEKVLDVRVVPSTGPVTGIGWDVAPEGVVRVLEWVRDRYGNPPVYITENGAAFPDVVTEAGRVQDHDRIAYIRDHLQAAHRAIAAGVDLRGWMVWSLIDTWEFSLGYEGRFGLVHVDYDTQRRTIKDSGFWYRDVMTANALPTSS